VIKIVSDTPKVYPFPDTIKSLLTESRLLRVEANAILKYSREIRKIAESKGK
jgi:hypothetical protein